MVLCFGIRMGLILESECEMVICQGKRNESACTEGKLEICDVGLQRAFHWTGSGLG